MSERDRREKGDQTLLEAPRSDPASARGRGKPYGPAPDEPVRLRSPARREQPLAEPRETDEDVEPQNRDTGGEARKSWFRRHPIAVAFGLLCLVLALPAGYLYWDYASHFETTDDAYIAARQFAIAPEVSGYITAVPVTDNEHVAAGSVIARIDDRTYRAALAQAEAQVAAARANIENIDAQIDCAAGPDQPPTRHRWTRRRRRWCSRRSRRRATNTWRDTIAGTVQNAQQYTSQLHQQQAALDSAQATLKLAQRQIEALKAQRDSAVASLAQAKAQREQAQLNLSYTTVTADQPGRVVQLTAAVGQYAQPGTNLTMFVPDDIWIWANFKETQLDQMRPGAAGDDRHRRLSGTHDPRSCRQRAARIRHRVLAASGRECHRQLGQDRAARAGQDRHGQSADRCCARPGHVRRGQRAGQSTPVAL